MKTVFYLCAVSIFSSLTLTTALADENQDCIEICGEGYFYDRPGAKNGGQERVCTKYPLSCGYNCTYGWNIRYLVRGTNYTCQEAQQEEPLERDDRGHFVPAGNNPNYY